MPLKKLDVAARDKILQLLETGLPVSAIALRFGVSTKTIRETRLNAKKAKRVGNGERRDIRDMNSFFARKEIIRLLTAAETKIRSHLLVTPEREALLKANTTAEKFAKLIEFRKFVSREFDRLLGDGDEMSKLRDEAKNWSGRETREPHQQEATW